MNISETYQKFNELVFNHFKSQSEGSDTFIMAFDENHFSSISEELKIRFEDLVRILSEEFRHSWGVYINQDEGQIPNSYGLVAFQIWIASKMGANKEFTHREYNPLLWKQIGIKQNNLQDLFSLFQDELWGLTSWHIKLSGFQTNIPEPRTHAGRYIQYPKSQAYWNRNDLLKLSGLFGEKNIKPNLKINFDDFVSISRIETKEDIKSQYLTHHSKKVLSIPEIEFSILQKQFYNFYLSWDGESPNYPKEKLSKTKLYYDDTKGYFLLLNNEEVLINENFQDLLKKYRVISNRTPYLLLIKDLSFGDFEESSFAKIGDEIIILVIKDNQLILQHLKRFHIKEERQGSYSKFRFILTEEHYNSYLKILISKTNQNLEWLSGVKLNRTYYLARFGPRFLVNKECNISINGKSKKFCKGDIVDLSKKECGEYTIQPRDSRRINFSIIDSELNKNSLQNQKGWNLNTLQIDDNRWDLAGCFLKNKSNNSTFTNRDFIDLSLKRTEKKYSDNQVLRILKNQK